MFQKDVIIARKGSHSVSPRRSNLANLQQSLSLAVKNLKFAREYTQSLLEDIGPDDWFAKPPGNTSHLAWQIGHLAMAEYALTMMRIRGKEPADRDLISNDFLRCFKKSSQPTFDASDYPPAETIRAVFDAVHVAALAELQHVSDEELTVQLPEPYAVFDTKLGSILFCSAHEMLHAGQIGMIRRLLGKPPIR